MQFEFVTTGRLRAFLLGTIVLSAAGGTGRFCSEYCLLTPKLSAPCSPRVIVCQVPLDDVVAESADVSSDGLSPEGEPSGTTLQEKVHNDFVLDCPQLDVEPRSSSVVCGNRDVSSRFHGHAVILNSTEEPLVVLPGTPPGFVS